MTEDGDDTGDVSATVTFYLSGPQTSDVTVTVFEDQSQLND